jgi:hypothetical protein
MNKKGTILIVALLTWFFLTTVSFSQNVDLNKYIGVKSFVKNLSYNYITKSGKSFTHVLTLYKNVTYSILVFSSNPDIKVFILDSNKSRTYEKIEKSVIKDKYYFFTINYTPKFQGKYNIQVKANKSQDFRYFFLTTYEVLNASDIPAKQNKTILAFDQLSKDFIDKNEIQIENKSYFRRLIGFLYFPTGQFNYRYFYRDNIFMAQSFSLDKNQKLAFYYGNDVKPNAQINVKINSETFTNDFQEFYGKSFIYKIKRDSLHTIDLDADSPTILLSYKLIENVSSKNVDISLTKPVDDRTEKFSVNLAGYVSNWESKPENYVIVRRLNGTDEAKFTLDPNLVGSTFNFDINIPLIPGTNKLIIEAVINGEKKILEKEVVAESSRGSLLVELTWDTPATDLDLYIMKPGGEVVCFENQNENNALKGWLDIDDKDGYGPERFRMDSPAPGLYKIYAHYYNGKTPTNAFAKVINAGSIIQLKGSLITSNKTNSAVEDIGNGPDCILLGEVEVK